MNASQSRQVRVDISWPVHPMLNWSSFNAINREREYAQLYSDDNRDASQPQVQRMANSMVLPLILQYLVFAVPGGCAALYQYFFPAKTYYLEECDKDQPSTYEENTLYFKTTENSNQIQWCSSLNQTWKNCHVVSRDDLLLCFSDRKSKQKEEKKAGIVDTAIEHKLLVSVSSDQISPTQRVWNTVKPLVRHEKTTASSVAISVGVGIALAVGVAACCSGFGAPVGVALVFGALAAIGKSCGISLSVAAGSIALSRISSGFHWHRKSAEKTAEQEMKEKIQASIEEDNWNVESDNQSTPSLSS